MKTSVLDYKQGAICQRLTVNSVNLEASLSALSFLSYLERFLIFTITCSWHCFYIDAFSLSVSLTDVCMPACLSVCGQDLLGPNSLALNIWLNLLL